VTSLISKDELEDELRRAGIRDPLALGRVMRLIELYAKRYPVLNYEDIPPVTIGDFRGYKYKCATCGRRKLIGEFGEKKKENTRVTASCLECERLTQEAG
jgi:hypothetical protein